MDNILKFSGFTKKNMIKFRFMNMMDVIFIAQEIISGNGTRDGITPGIAQ